MNAQERCEFDIDDRDIQRDATNPRVVMIVYVVLSCLVLFSILVIVTVTLLMNIYGSVVFLFFLSVCALMYAGSFIWKLLAKDSKLKPFQRKIRRWATVATAVIVNRYRHFDLEICHMEDDYSLLTDGTTLPADKYGQRAAGGGGRSLLYRFTIQPFLPAPKKEHQEQPAITTVKSDVSSATGTRWKFKLFGRNKKKKDDENLNSSIPMSKSNEFVYDKSMDTNKDLGTSNDEETSQDMETNQVVERKHLSESTIQSYSPPRAKPENESDGSKSLQSGLDGKFKLFGSKRKQRVEDMMASDTNQTTNENLTKESDENSQFRSSIEVPILIPLSLIKDSDESSQFAESIEVPIDTSQHTHPSVTQQVITQDYKILDIPPVV